MCVVWQHRSLAGLLDEGDSDEDSGPEEEEGQEKDRLCHGDDYH